MWLYVSIHPGEYYNSQQTSFKNSTVPIKEEEFASVERDSYLPGKIALQICVGVRPRKNSACKGKYRETVRWWKEINSPEVIHAVET